MKGLFAAGYDRLSDKWPRNPERSACRVSSVSCVWGDQGRGAARGRRGMRSGRRNASVPRNRPARWLAGAIDTRRRCSRGSRSSRQVPCRADADAEIRSCRDGAHDPRGRDRGERRPGEAQHGRCRWRARATAARRCSAGRKAASRDDHISPESWTKPESRIARRGRKVKPGPNQRNPRVARPYRWAVMAKARLGTTSHCSNGVRPVPRKGRTGIAAV